MVQILIWYWYDIFRYWYDMWYVPQWGFRWDGLKYKPMFRLISSNMFKCWLRWVQIPFSGFLSLQSFNGFGDRILGDLSKATGWGWLRNSNREHWAGDTAYSWILEGMWKTPAAKFTAVGVFFLRGTWENNGEHAYLFSTLIPTTATKKWPPRGPMTLKSLWWDRKSFNHEMVTTSTIQLFFHPS